MPVELALVLMAALTSAAFVFHERDRREWRAERQNLLDRIQAPSYHELKSYDKPAPARAVYLSDADEAALEAAS